MWLKKPWSKVSWLKTLLIVNPESSISATLSSYESLSNWSRCSIKKPLIILIYVYQSYDTLIISIHQVIIYIPWLLKFFCSKIGFIIIFILLYLFIILVVIILLIDSKNVHFYYIFNLFIKVFIIDIATTNHCKKPVLFSSTLNRNSSIYLKSY